MTKINRGALPGLFFFLQKLIIGNNYGFIRGKRLATLNELNGKANSSHNHSASNITSGTLSVSRGGTGRSTLTSGYFLRGNGTGAVTLSSVDDVRAAIGIGSEEVIDPPAAPMSIPAVGGTLNWANNTWRVVHKMTGLAILGLTTIPELVQFSEASVGEYLGSTLYCKCMEFAIELKLYACDYVVDFMGGKVFIPGYDQLNGGFSYFTSASNRICNYNGIPQHYWTSSPYSFDPDCVWVIDGNGYFNPIGYSSPTSAFGFRPFVALRL